MDETAKNTPQEPGGESWEFQRDFNWSAGPQSGVRRLDVFPVNWKQMTQKQVTRELKLLENYVWELFKGAYVDGHQNIQIAELPLRICPAEDLRLFVEDYSKIELTTNNAYYVWNYNYSQEGYQQMANRGSLRALGELQEAGIRGWRLCTKDEAKIIFQGEPWGGWGVNSGTISGVSLYDTIHSKEFSVFPTGASSQYYHISQGQIRNFGGTSCTVADVYVAGFPEDFCLLDFLLERRWTPVLAVGTLQWQELTELYQRQFIQITSEWDDVAAREEFTILPTPQLFQALESGETLHIGGASFTAGSPQLLEEAREEVLRCDTQRANITPYDPMQLEDPNRGSWELWAPPMDEMVMMSIPAPVYARDPRLDVRPGGVIAIDFGTKSTVVARQDDSDYTHLVRIGKGLYDQEARDSDYENPTVMEFVDLDSFLRAYRSREGRPATSWSDLTVSHTANDMWKDNKDSSKYFSFFGELKQWAGNQNQNLRVRDRTGTTELTLPPYLSISEGEFDPIELYAYYIGLYINNMHTSQIYLEYLLSFPVTYPEEVRKRILDSFRRGLAKSLPQAVLDDPECQEQFSVRQGAGEPAAYAVCALQEYQFQPEEGENVYYAIFDFGGGTADFDFGVWRRAPRGNGRRRKYNYIISHFGDGGDRYLGGENLLELLSYQVFRDNQSQLRQAGITFSRPPQCEPFKGSVGLLANSQEAHTNMRQMKEALRPLWERPEGWESEYASGAIKLDLVKQDGSWALGTQIQLDSQRLEAILRGRLAEGVDKFIHALSRAFKPELYKSHPANRIHIFLAGNAGKSELLRQVFDEKLAAFAESIGQCYQERGEYDHEDLDFFQLYPPLGTPEAQAIMRERGCTFSEDEEVDERPTGKTGVAFGLILCREGSPIKVENEVAQDQEIKFTFSVGYNDDGFFAPCLTRDTPYGQWVEYLEADAAQFEFYFSTDPTAQQPGRLPVSKAKKRGGVRIPASAVNEDWWILLRPTGPSQLEYVVAKSLEDAAQERYECPPKAITLEN